MIINQTIKIFFSRAAMMLLPTILFAMTAQTAWAEATVSFPTTSGGSGTSDDPYKISSTADLDKLAADVNSGTNYKDVYFIVTQDIAYTHKANGEDGADTENNYTPIGRGKYFQGYFDGNGKTISGIRIYLNYTEYQLTFFGPFGLFGRIGSSAEVKNVTLSDTRIASGSVGGIVGNNAGGKVTNCHVTNTVEIQGIGDISQHGGIVDYNGYYNEIKGIVSGCVSEAKFTNCSGIVGGIAAANQGTLENNFVIGVTIPAIEDNTRGAIVGRNIESTLTNNYYTACTVAGTANATNVGVGLNGYNQPVGDVAENNGALCVYKMTLAEGVTDITVDASAKVYSYDSKDYYTPGTTVKLTYTGTPAKGYKFDGIDAGEGVTVTSSGNDYTITMPARDVIASINFILKGDINGDNVVNVADIVKAINDGKSQDEINEIVNIIMDK